MYRTAIFATAVVLVACSPATTASCGPSRAVIYTGLHTHQNGQDAPSLAFAHRRILGKEQGYIPLFNGRNLDGWVLRRANRKGYIVEEGLLVCPADGGGYLFTEAEYSDFSLRFEFRLSKGANNGVAIRCPLLDQRPAYDGIEIQILDNVGFPRELRPSQYHGSVYDVVPAKKGALKPAGQWNEQEILCRGRRITVIVNEMVVLDADLDKVTTAEVREKHPGLLRNSGHVGFLGHGSRVDFRNIRIKDLAPGTPPPGTANQSELRCRKSPELPGNGNYPQG